jgi:HAE1 family hydrophobic/amphiphilic exporter-1
VFSDIFIRRPILATVCSLVIILAGAIAIPSLPIARYPELAPPSVTVTAFYTGANAQSVESAVTTPIEQVINGVEGMLYMTSSSTNGGLSTITVTFEVGRDPDLAAINVQNRVNQALGRLPTDVRTNGVTVTKNTAGFLGALGFYSDENKYDSLFISNYLDRYVRDALKRVPGVGNVIIFGERKYAMRLWLDPEKLAARGLTAGDVTGALREQNVQVAAGSIGDSPAPDDQMFQLSVRAGGRLSEAAQFEDIVVKSGANGALVRVKDIGRVELGAENYSSRLRFAGFEASGIGVQLLPSANALEVFDGVQKEMNRLEQNFPPGLHWKLAFDNVIVVRESITEVLYTLLEAILLVVLVMFVFLQNWRSTIIPAITIPVSLIGTFAFIKLFDFSINTLTLFGIVLATGIVVDDAIVVIENIERHMREEKKNAAHAAVDAMKEVFGAVVVIGIVLVSVFVPVAFFPGTTGRLYQQFSLTIAFSVVLSVFNAVTFTPALSALLLDKEEHGEPNRVFRGVNRVIDGGTNLYVRALRGALAWRYVMLGLFALSLVGTYFVYKSVPPAFVPEEDEGYFIAIVQAPGGSSLEYTTDILKRAETIIQGQPEVAAMFSVAGFSFSGSAPNQGLMFVRLKGFEERDSPDKSLAAVLNRIRGPLFGIPGAIVVPVAPPAIQGLSTFGGFQFEVLDQSGGEISGLAAAAGQLMAAGNQSGQVAGLYSSFTANDPQLTVSIDRDRARSLGLPMGQITDALSAFLGSQYVNDFDFGNRAYRVYVQADEQFRSQPSNLRQFYARSQSGQMVPLDTVVKLGETTAPAVISHFNMFRSAEITGSALPGVSSGQAINAMEDLARKNLPAGFDFTWAGQSLEEIKAGSQAVYIFALSIVLVYLVLAAQYESWVLPFIILLGVPLAVVGALLAQMSRGFSNDIFCQVGLVMLIGLAAKNSILIVEFAEQLREQGHSIFDAAVEAARIRLRPILMTSFAFILGVLPLALATGAGAGARNSVGTTVAGGMLASTLLSVIFIPVLYVLIRSLAPGKGSRSHIERTAGFFIAVMAVGAATAFAAPAPQAAQGQSAPRQAMELPASPTTATPVKTVTFEEAVSTAVTANPTVAQAATSIARAEALLQQARAGTRPTISASFANVTLDDERGFSGSVTQPRNQSTIAGNITVPVLQASRWASVNQARDQIAVAEASTDEAKQQIAVAAAQAYLAVIAQKRQVDVSERALTSARTHLDYASRRLQAGAGSRLNELRADQEVTTDLARLESARLALRRAQEGLGALLAIDGPVDVAGEPAFEVPPADAGIDARTDVRLQRALIAAGRRVLTDSKRDWFPSANLSFDPSYVTPSGLFQPSNSWRLTFSVTQPIFDAGQRKAVAAQRRVALDAATFGLAATENEARAEVRIARVAVESYQRIADTSRRSAEQAAEVLRITNDAFGLGATTNLEVIDAQRSARDAEAAAVIADDAVRQAKLLLLVALGRFPR